MNRAKDDSLAPAGFRASLIDSQKDGRQATMIDITTHQAAKLLGVTVRTVQNWVGAGKLRATQTAGGHRRIPLADVQTLLERQQVDDAPAAPPRQLKVLVVEDDPTLLKLYALKMPGFAVPHQLLVASDGLQGLLMLGLHKPDILILDLMIPGMDGFDMLRTLQRMPDFKALTIIVVTGLSAGEILDRGGLPPGVTLAPKPVSFDVIETIFAQKATQLGIAIKPHPARGA